MSLVDEMGGRVLRGEGVVRRLWVAASGSAGGEVRWCTGGFGRAIVGVMKDDPGVGRTRGYLAVAVKVDGGDSVMG